MLERNGGWGWGNHFICRGTRIRMTMGFSETIKLQEIKIFKVLKNDDDDNNNKNKTPA